MNKTLIALAVSAAAVATGVNAESVNVNQSGDRTGSTVYSSQGSTLEIGGRAEARLSVKDGNAEDASRVRLNFLGKVAINDSLYGVGFYEGEFVGSDSDVDNRYVYAGIGGNFGEVTYGKNDGALGVITDFTDIMSYHGNSAAYKIDVADRTDNMVSYKGQFADFGLKASYNFADRTDSNTDSGYDNNDEDGYSLSAIYAIGDTGVKLGAGYADGVRSYKEGKVSKTATDASQYILAVSYQISDFYVAGTFVDGDEKQGTAKVDRTGYEFAAGYKLGQAAFTTTYNKLEEKASGDKVDTADNIAIDATYYFKPNFRTYISYNFNLLDEDANKGITKAQAEDELALGLRYDF